MEKINIECPKDFDYLKSYVQENKFTDCKIFNQHDKVFLKFNDNEEFCVSKIDTKSLNTFLKPFIEKQELKNIIFGKNDLENVVSCEIDHKNKLVVLYIEKDGEVTTRYLPHSYWVLLSTKRFKEISPHADINPNLMGGLHYDYIKFYNNSYELYAMKKHNSYHKDLVWSVSDQKESAMLTHGFTYYKGMKVSDVSVLAFDIEATTLTHGDKSRVLLISNTFRKQGKVIRKMFCCDEYENDKEMFEAWCNWIREVNPSIVLGHNIFGYDFPYINFCAKTAGAKLEMGRDGSDLTFNRYTSKFRKDGSQDYEYTRCFIHGREIVDTMFVAYHFDYARKYESYGLKQIIKQENLEIKDRQFYDASKIAANWDNPVEREKIKRYAEHDADDALALFDLMINSYFYACQSIPKTFQTVNYSATGSQVNSILVRSYLQDGHSIPKASDVQKYPGAISLGNPGVYKNCWKIDLNALYPSIILQYSIYDKEKDPKSNFLKMVDYFTKQRLTDKQKAKETGDRYYSELEQSRKIFINSSYGLLGAAGLNFNSFPNADKVTAYGREILKKAIKWATGNELEIKSEEDEV